MCEHIDVQITSGQTIRSEPILDHALLEANAKVNWRALISHPIPSKPLNEFRCRFKYITRSPKGVDVQNLVGIDSAITVLRMREKHV